MFDLRRPEWMSRANCKGLNPSIFITERGEDSKPAKKICADCRVADECRDYAVRKNEDGVWGGTSERDRKKIRRKKAS